MPDDDIDSPQVTSPAHEDTLRIDFIWKLAFDQGSFQINNGKLYRNSGDFRAAVDKLRAIHAGAPAPVSTEPKQVQVAPPRTQQIPQKMADRFQGNIPAPAPPQDPVQLRPNMPAGTAPIVVDLPEAGTKPAPLPPRRGRPPNPKPYAPPPISQGTTVPNAAAAAAPHKYQ